MRIAFVQEELYPYLSFMFMAAIAKENGHEVDVFIANVDKSFIQTTANFKPDLVCFSTTTPNYSFSRDSAKGIKALHPTAFILMGGWHPTFYPELLENETCFDALCQGEGEIPFRLLLEAFGNKERMKQVSNLHIRIDGEIYRNPMSNLIEDLDEIAFPDRSMYYDKFDLLRDVPTKIFISGRGCPFPCTYCFNEKMKQKYKSKGQYVRFRSPKNIVDEIKAVQAKYPLKYIQFFDDTFNSNRKWVLSFLDYYKMECGIPFLANCRINMLDEEVISKMKEAGVAKINLSIEHGSEEMRDLLKRKMTNEEILEGGRLMRKYKIRFHLSNIVGFPGETLDMALETLKLNQQLKPEFAAMHVLQPYPGTELYEIYRERGLIGKDLDVNSMSALSAWGTRTSHITSIFKQDNINQLVNLHSFFSLLVQHPYLFPVVRPLMDMKPNKYFEFFQAWYIFKNKFKYATNAKERCNFILQLTRNLFPDFIQNALESFFANFGIYRQK